MAKGARIFISHSGRDAEWCDAFVARLRETDADIWYDRVYLGFGSLTKIINTELASRPIVIGILSPNAVESNWVRREIAAAINMGDRDPRRVLAFTVAEKCQVPPLWGDYVPIAGLNGDGMNPRLAAEEAIRRLGLAPAKAPQAPAPPANENATSADALLRGLVLLNQERFEEALAGFEEAVALDASSFAAWSDKGNALVALNRPDDALAAFDHALALDPQSVATISNKGTLLCQMGRFTEGLAELDRAMAMQPAFAPAWYNRASALFTMRLYSDALSAYDKALSLDPEYALAWHGKGRALFELGRHMDAFAAQNSALAINLHYLDARYWQGRAHAALGQHAKALAAFGQVIAKRPGDYHVWALRGFALESLGRFGDALLAFDEALTAFERCLTLDRRFSKAWRLLDRQQQRVAVERRVVPHVARPVVGDDDRRRMPATWQAVTAAVRVVGAAVLLDPGDDNRVVATLPHRRVLDRAHDRADVLVAHLGVFRVVRAGGGAMHVVALVRHDAAEVRHPPVKQVDEELRIRNDLRQLGWIIVDGGEVQEGIGLRGVEREARTGKRRPSEANIRQRLLVGLPVQPFGFELARQPRRVDGMSRVCRVRLIKGVITWNTQRISAHFRRILGAFPVHS